MTSDAAHIDPSYSYFIWNGYPCVMERNKGEARVAAFVHGQGWAAGDPGALWYAVPSMAERVSEDHFVQSIGPAAAEAPSAIASADWQEIRKLPRRSARA